MYTNICLLFPFIIKRGRFPLSYLEIFVGDECAQRWVEGVGNRIIIQIKGSGIASMASIVLRMKMLQACFSENNTPILHRSTQIDNNE